MRKLIMTIIICLVLAPTVAFAHHPSEDIVDAEIFEFIDDMVSDTPHATLDFDSMGNMVITTEFVSTAEALIQEGLLSHASLLEGDVTITMEFPSDTEASVFSKQLKDKADKRHSKWSEWGGEVVITIIQDL
jgi:hypothetical protein